jgi:hypothetical protein
LEEYRCWQTQYTSSILKNNLYKRMMSIRYIHQGKQFVGAITISFIIDANGMVRGECICLPPTRISLTTQEKEALQGIRQMPQ